MTQKLSQAVVRAVRTPQAVLPVSSAQDSKLCERPRSRSPLARVGLRLRLLRLALGPVFRRVCDIVGSLLGIIALSPVFLLATVAIKLTSRGPVFYSQERIGKFGEPFRMLKFRTMIVDADAMKAALATQQCEAMSGVRFKLERDPRITSVGRFLRKFSIDELPQFVNVLMGDMTIIGPRPPVASEVALYDARAARRLEVTPGLTCLWQVGGRSDLSFDEQVQLDIDYIDKVRWLDELKIFVRTIPAVLTGRGAY